MVTSIFALLGIAALAASALVPLTSGVAAAVLYIALFLAVGVFALAVLERHIVAVIAIAQADRVRVALQELQLLSADHDDHGDVVPASVPSHVAHDDLDDQVYPEDPYDTRRVRRAAYEAQLRDLDAETPGR